MTATRVRPSVARTALRGWLVALACIVVAAVGLQVSEPDDDVQTTVGAPGESVPYGAGTVTIDDVRVGQRMEQFSLGHTTPGMYVVLSATLAAEGSNTQWLNSFTLRSGDRSYLPYQPATLEAAPGFQQTADVAFEIDPNEIDGLVLQASYDQVLSSYHQQLQIPLGITPDNAQAWRDAAVGQTIELRDTVDRAVP